jgi:hypothetical protein
MGTLPEMRSKATGNPFPSPKVLGLKGGEGFGNPAAKNVPQRSGLERDFANFMRL